MLRKDKLLGGVLGLAIGDALGVPVEFVQREVLKSSPVESMEGYGSHNQPVGTWSDDTSMVLATLDSMCRGFSTDGMMEAFSRWYNMAEYVFKLWLNWSNVYSFLTDVYRWIYRTVLQ